MWTIGDIIQYFLLRKVDSEGMCYELMKDNLIVPIWEKLNLTKQEAAAYSNICINKIEEMLKDPRCPFVFYVGTKKLVKRKEFEQFIAKTIEI